MGQKNHQDNIGEECSEVHNLQEREKDKGELISTALSMKDKTLKHNVWIHGRKLIPGVKFTETRRAYKHHCSYFHVVDHYQLKGLGPVQEQQREDLHHLFAARFLCCEVQVGAQCCCSFAVMKVAI